MLIKIIGSVIIGATALILAISHCRYEDRRLRTLDGFISLLFYIKGQIDCYALPLTDILASLPVKIYSDCNTPEGAMTLDEMIENSRIYLEEESERLLEAFASEFGSTFRDEQMRRCDHYIAALGEQRRQLFADVDKRRRVGSAIWVCSSLCLLILLW
jgi:hypothetical protein